MEQYLAALRRRETYTGYAREALNLARCAARMPLGLLDGAIACGRPSGETEHDTPVLLVHGFGHNRSGWFAINNRLRRAGFTSVHAWNYDPFRNDIPGLGWMLRDRVQLLRRVTGADRVHVVGHSLGGVLLRWYVQELGGDRAVDTAITIASPHEGTQLASMVPAGLRFGGRTAAQLSPSSWVMRELAAGARHTDVRWLAFYSNLDALVKPVTSAMITAPALRATNVLIKDAGHISIMLSPQVSRTIVDVLEQRAPLPASAAAVA